MCVERVQKPATGKEAPEYPLRTATDTGSRGGTGDDGDGIPEVGQARGDHADRYGASSVSAERLWGPRGYAATTAAGTSSVGIGRPQRPHTHAATMATGTRSGSI